MGIFYHTGLIQGTDEWLAARCGLLTASEMKKVLTPTLKLADNADSRGHVYELLAQRISRFVEPSFISDDMLRGHEDELIARSLYSERYAPVEEVGFVTNDRWGFTLGCSPDGLVGTDGMIECKSRRQKYQVQTIIDDAVPPEHWMQVQTALLVTEREWLDYVSYSGGLPMVTIRVYPDAKTQAAIVAAAAAFEARIVGLMEAYQGNVGRSGRYIPTERRVEQEMHV